MNAKAMATKAVAWMIALLMILSAVPLFVGAAESSEYVPCDGTHTGDWSPWDGSTEIASDGNYYLTGDVESTVKANIKAENVTVCLNGHRSGGLSAVGTLNLCDCKGTGTVTYHGQPYSESNVGVSAQTVYLYGGTVTGCYRAVCATFLYLMGGSITGNTGGEVLVIKNGGILILQKGVIANNFYYSGYEDPYEVTQVIYGHVYLTGTDVQITTPLRMGSYYDPDLGQEIEFGFFTTVAPDPAKTKITMRCYDGTVLQNAEGSSVSLDGAQYCISLSDSYAVVYDEATNTLVCREMDLKTMPTVMDPTFEMTLAEGAVYQWYRVVDGEGIAVEGETAATLNSYEMYETYYCEIRYPSYGLAQEACRSLTVTMDPTLTKYPTLDDPSVEVNFADQVTSYQWYEAENVMTEIVEESGVDHIDNEYDSEKGWLLYGSDDVMGDQGVVSLSLDGLEQGKYLYMKSTAPLDSMFMVYFSSEEYYGIPYYGQSIGSNTEWICRIPHSGYYYLGFDAEGDENEMVLGHFRAYVIDGVELGEAVAGETSATLENPQCDKQYSCQVTYENGATVNTPVLSIKNTIIKQPTETDPSVEVTFPEHVNSYQWYRAAEMVSEITNENANGTTNYGTATYDPVTGWTGVVKGSTAYFFSVPMKAGDMLNVRSDSIGTIAILAETEGSVIYGASTEDGYGVTAPYDDTYILIARVLTEPVTVYVTSTVTEWNPVEAETKAVLENPEVGGHYFCRVTYADGTTEDSDAVAMRYTFIKQPTETDPSVKVTFEKDVASYQWYEKSEDSSEVTDQMVDTDFSDYFGGASSYDPAAGWTGINYYGSYYALFFISLKTGDRLSIESSKELSLVGMVDYDTGAEIYGEDYGMTASITATSDGNYMLVVEAYSSPTLRVYLNGSSASALGAPVTGETSPTLGSFEAEKSYVCVVTYQDGTVIYSDAVSPAAAEGGASFVGATVLLGTDLSIRYRVSLGDVVLEDGQSLCVTFERNGKSVTVAADADNPLAFTYQGIAPQAMTDPICATLYLADGEGNIVKTLAKKDGYSIRENAKNLLEEYASDETMVQLLTDMLCYGAAAQEYTGYRSDDLATNRVTAMGKPSDLLPEGSDMQIETYETGSAKLISASVGFGHVNVIRVKISAASMEGIRVLIDGEEVPADQIEDLGGGVWAVYTEAISAVEMDRIFEISLYEGETLLQTLTYNVRAYVVSMQNSSNETMAKLAATLYRYGKSAESYKEASK